MTKSGQRFAAGLDRKHHERRALLDKLRREPVPGVVDLETRSMIEDIRARVADGTATGDVERMRTLLAEYDRLEGDEKTLIQKREELAEITWIARRCANMERVLGINQARTRDVPRLVAETTAILKWKELPMSEIIVHTTGDGALRDAFRAVGITGPVRDGAGRIDPRVVHIGDNSKVHLAGLEHGMQSGMPSTVLAFELPPPDGRMVMLELSLRSLLDAADMLKLKFGDPRAYAGEMFVEGLRRQSESMPDEFRGIVKEADRLDFAYRDIGRPTGKLARDEVEKHLRISMPADAELRARVRTHGVALDANDIPAADGTKTIRITAGKAREAFEAMAREETDMTDELRADLLDVAASLATVDPEQMVRFESNPSDAHVGRVVLETQET